MLDKVNGVRKNNKIGLSILLLSGIAFLSIVPVLRGYVANTGESLLWCLRIARFLPAQYVEKACLIILMILRIGITLSAYLFFYILNSIYDGHWINVFRGLVLFVFCPYQLYIAYDKVDLTDMLLWILVLLFSSVALLFVKNAKIMKTGSIVLLSIVELILFMGMSVTYLVSHVNESTLSFGSKGYAFGEMFTSFFYSDNHPGYGIALFFTICLWIYYSLIETGKKENANDDEKDKRRKRDYLSLVFALIAVLFMVLSSINFPWDSIIRDVPIAGKFIMRLEAPTIFFGLSGFCFCVPAVKGMANAGKTENELVATILTSIILFLAVSIGLFLMSDYMYWQCPLEFAGM